MKINFRIYIFLMILLFVASCSNDTIIIPHTYFSLSNYFKEQAEELQKNKMKINKKINRNNEQETKLFTDVDWKKELKPFLECDINKPAWIQSYQTDTIFSNQGLMKVNYKAKEENLAVRSIVLSINNKNNVVEITIHKVRHNFYYQSDIVYTYNVTKGFIIIGRQHVRLLDQTVYHIEGNFIP